MPPVLLTQRALIRVVAEKWKQQYCTFQGVWRDYKGAESIYDQLRGLDGETATPDDVEDIVGNRSWTRLTCNECGQDVERVVFVGEPEDHDSATAALCEPCARLAVEAFSKVEGV